MDLQQALDRMCTPLHETRLSGYTAELDARCMAAIRDAIAAKDAEIARLREALVRSNTQAEQFERKWYLRGDVIEDCIPALESGLDAAQVISIFSDERPALIRDALAKARAALSQESGL